MFIRNIIDPPSLLTIHSCKYTAAQLNRTNTCATRSENSAKLRALFSHLNYIAVLRNRSRGTPEISLRIFSSQSRLKVERKREFRDAVKIKEKERERGREVYTFTF